MGRIVLTENMTLDGVIDASGNWFSPTGDDRGEADAELLDTIREQMKTEQALLVGRKTFEEFRGFWPAQTDDTTGISAHLNEVHKFVFSKTLRQPDWQNTTIIAGNLIDEIAKLKRSVDGDIGVTGSIMLVHELIASQLVDEYRLFVYPVVLGHGRRLLQQASGLHKLQLTATRGYGSGIVLMTYQSRPKVVGR